MKTIHIKIVLIIISLFTFIDCAPDSVDLNFDINLICWTILDDSNNETIYGVITKATLKNNSDEIEEITFITNPSGVSYSNPAFGNIIYAEISAEGYE